VVTFCSLVLVALGLLVAGLRWVAWSVKQVEARAIEVLAGRSCPACRVELAPHAKALAAQAGDRRRASLADAQSRGERLRVDGRWHFSCPECRVELVFDPQTFTLHTVSPVMASLRTEAEPANQLQVARGDLPGGKLPRH
jgi:hypothetical protein